jgi:hypothetical protein
MADETGAVSEADCMVCRDLDPGKRPAMRSDLLEIPPRGAVCDQCLQAWAVNVGFACLLEEPTQN